MIIPVNIDHRELEREEVCYYDDWEKSIRCNDYNTRYEYEVDEIEFEYNDLKDIVEEYTDDIIDILLSDRQLLKALLKKLRNRKDILISIDEKNSEH